MCSDGVIKELRGTGKAESAEGFLTSRPSVSAFVPCVWKKSHTKIMFSLSSCP